MILGRDDLGDFFALFQSYGQFAADALGDQIGFDREASLGAIHGVLSGGAAAPDRDDCAQDQNGKRQAVAPPCGGAASIVAAVAELRRLLASGQFHRRVLPCQANDGRLQTRTEEKIMWNGPDQLPSPAADPLHFGQLGLRLQLFAERIL